jgi:hypothetical protein
MGRHKKTRGTTIGQPWEKHEKTIGQPVDKNIGTTIGQPWEKHWTTMRQT